MKDLGLLVVDDDPLVTAAIEMSLPKPWRIVRATSAADLPDRGFHAALVDMHLTEETTHAGGIEVIRRLAAGRPSLEIVAMSGDLDRQIMEQCLKAGASRFLAKPLSLNELRLTLGKIEALLQLCATVPRGVGPNYGGRGRAAQNVRRQIAQLTNEPGPILIEGESGTGKEVVAQLLHARRPGRPFVIINAAAMPDTLFESEFFGHVKGAFTGADQNKIGLAEAAGGGDLFLDEIEALSPALQAKLLRFLETFEVRRLGGKDSITVDVRVIAATNRPLDALVAEGKFRDDLRWRFSGKKIALPPLRDRAEDVEELARTFFALDSHRRKTLDPEALEELTAYAWPGNVRELKRVCEELVLRSPLPFVRRQDVLAILRAPVPTGDPAITLRLDLGLGQLVENFEAQILRRALGEQNDIDEVARTLKISRSSLYKKIKDHGIQWRSD